MVEMYEFLYNELTIDERNEFWDEFYDWDVVQAWPDLQDQEF